MRARRVLSGRNEGRNDGRSEGRGDGRGRRNERGERPAGDDTVGTENAEAARTDDRSDRSGRGGNRGESRGEGRVGARGEPRADARSDSRGEPRGDGRRGSRPEREPRPVVPVAEGSAEEAVVAQAFVDTQPGADALDTVDANGERQPGRRRNRRGGRGGRDREVVAADGALIADGAAPADAPPTRTDDGVTEPDSGVAADGAPAGEGAPRGEAGEGRRRGRGRDRQRRERPEEGQTEAAVHDDTAAPADSTTAELRAALAMANEARATSSTEPVESAIHDAQAPASTRRDAAVDPVAGAPRSAPDGREAAAAPVAGGLREAPESRLAEIDPIVGVSRTVAAEAATAAVSAPVEATAAFELPMASLQSVAEAAGLQWVNSDVDKIRSVQAAMAAEPAAVRVPRERKPAAPVDDGPLVLVETRKDLSQFKLPFDTADGSRPPA